MRLLLHTGTRDCLNLGDVAMLQAAIRHLRVIWPDSRPMVLTDAPETLVAACPGALPVAAQGLYPWIAERFLMARLHPCLPQGWSRRLVEAKHAIGRRWPGVLKTAVTLKLRIQSDGACRAAVEEFLRAFESADCVVICGQGSLNDSAPVEAAEVCALLELAASARKPAFLFSQGIGPLRDPRLSSTIQRALSTAHLVGLREERYGPSVLAALGIAPERVMITGDDAIEAAYDLRPARSGTALGLSLRLSRNSAFTPDDLRVATSAIRNACDSMGVPVLPVPISIHKNGTNDAEVLESFFDSCAWDPSGLRQLQTPQAVIAQTGRCRLMIAMAYHAAVFALAQGIPTVCVANSAFFEEKFQGLADLFGAGCQVVPFRPAEFCEQLASTARLLWDEADELRPLLLDRAALQIKWAREAYGRAARIFAQLAAAKAVA
jgi:colanic acid/amylovoran biosynthesis protein